MMEQMRDPEQGTVVEGKPASAYYGTFQGQQDFPQPSAPSGAVYYPPVDRSYIPPVQGIHTRASDSLPLLGDQQYEREDKLPFCNIGWGWFLFILGFFSVIPWYIGATVFLMVAYDHRERTGLMACAIASLVVILQVVLVSGWDHWADRMD